VRLLLITSVFPSPRRPTKGTFNRELVSGLREAGDDVRVVVPVPWTDLLRTRRSGKPERGASYPLWWFPPRVGHSTHHHWMSRSLQARALRATRHWDPDLVLGYWTHPDGTVALELARRLGVPGVVLAGGSDIQLLTRDAARRRIIVETLRAADRVFTVGAPLRDAAIALGVAPEKVGILDRGVDRNRFFDAPPDLARQRLGLPCDRPIVLWVGRMVPVKGLDVLLESWSAVSRAPSHPLLLLIGDGDDRRALQRQAAGLGDSVRFVGTVRHDALPDWYRAADCVVLPSRSEGIPNVLLEALACGTPFVASAVGGVSTLLEDASSTVPPDDPAALTAALLARVAMAPMSRRAHAEIPDRRNAIASLRRALQAMIATAPRPAAELLA
jgi:teichuronic acid biosynthesis glycosyltransferase TuaC